MINRLKNHYFFSQPHQPFFILAFINAILSMALFGLFFEGNLTPTIPAKLYHAYSIIYLLFTPAFLAFLFTTFPRFSATEPIEKEAYMRVFLFFALGSLFVHLGVFLSIPLINTGIFLLFIGHVIATSMLLEIYKKSKVTDKYDQFWILVATTVGVFAHFLFLIILWLPSLYTFAIQLSIYLYLLLIFFAVAQRMVPFFSHSPIERHTERFKVIVGLLALHIVLELIDTHSSFLADFILAYLFGKEIFRWRLPFPNPNPLVWILHIALFWVPVAFLLSSISSLIALINGSSFLYLGIHTLALGFFLTMLIGFGTRVTIGHSGNQMRADKYTTTLFYITQVIVVMRIITSLNNNFLIFFELSIFIWLLLFISWGVRFFRVLIFGDKL